MEWLSGHASIAIAMSGPITAPVVAWNERIERISSNKGRHSAATDNASILYKVTLVASVS